MQMNSSIILAGQPVNALSALNAGTQAAGLAGQVGQQGDLYSLYRDQGEGIANGDPNALNALSRLDPMASLGVQDTRQGMQARDEQMQLARSAGARAAQSHAATMTAAQRAEEAASSRRALEVALPALRQAEQTGDLTSLNQMLRTAGMPAVDTVEDAYIMYMQVEGAVESLETFQGLTQGPAGAQPDWAVIDGQLVDRAAVGGPSVVPIQGAGPRPTDAPEVRNIQLENGAEVAVQWDGELNEWVPINAPQGGATPRQAGSQTELQARLSLFSAQQTQVAPTIDGFEVTYDPSNLQDATAARLGTVGNYMQTSEGQRYRAAAQVWLEGALRLQTGAAATQPEVDRLFSSYFAQPGDTPETVTFKRGLRAAFLRSIEAAQGQAPELTPVPAMPATPGATPAATPAPSATPGALSSDALQFLNGGN